MKNSERFLSTINDIIKKGSIKLIVSIPMNDARKFLKAYPTKITFLSEDKNFKDFYILSVKESDAINDVSQYISEFSCSINNDFELNNYLLYLYRLNNYYDKGIKDPNYYSKGYYLTEEFKALLRQIKFSIVRNELESIDELPETSNNFDIYKIGDKFYRYENSEYKEVILNTQAQYGDLLCFMPEEISKSDLQFSIVNNMYLRVVQNNALYYFQIDNNGDLILTI